LSYVSDEMEDKMLLFIGCVVRWCRGKHFTLLLFDVVLELDACIHVAAVWVSGHVGWGCFFSVYVFTYKLVYPGSCCLSMEAFI